MVDEYASFGGMRIDRVSQKKKKLGGNLPQCQVPIRNPT
jgi:hypothetical protein